jgi:protocatechuate 3,4-dioxygenase beta subunit
LPKVRAGPGYTPNSGFTGTDSFVYEATYGVQNSNPATVTITVQDPDATSPFLNLPAVYGSVWQDQNSNGFFDGNEQGLAGMTVQLLDGDTNALVASTATDDSGQYTFVNLTPGNYYVAVSPATGYAFTLEGGDSSVDASGNSSTFALGANDAVPLNAGLNSLNQPVARDDSYATLAGSTLVVPAPGVTANDTTPAGQTLVVALVNAPAHGAVALAADGSMQYTPAAGFIGTDWFTYQASADGLVSNVSTVTVTVEDPSSFPGGGTNLPSGSTVTLNGSTYVISYPGGQPAGMTLTLTSQPSIAGLVWQAPNAGGTFQAGASGFPGVSVQLCDARSNNVVGSTTTDANGLYNFAGVAPGSYHLIFGVPAGYAFSPTGQYSEVSPTGITPTLQIGSNQSIEVNAGLLPLYRPPIVQDASYSMIAGSPLVVAAPGVVADDTVSPGQTVSVSLVSGPAHGAVTYNTDGSFLYTPAGGFIGTDSFTYQFSDGIMARDVATVMLTVQDPNAVPGGGTGLPDGSTLTLNGSNYTVSYPGGPGTAMVLTLASQPTIEGLIWADQNASGSFQQGDSGLVGITVQLCDATTGSAIAATSTDVNGLYNFAGVAPGVYYLLVTLPNGFAFTTEGEDSNVDAGGRTAGLVLAANQLVDLNAGLVTVHPPVAASDAYATLAGSTLVVPSAGVAANDLGLSGQSLTVAVVSGPADGTLTLAADGSFVYSPNNGFLGVDSFTYQNSVGGLLSNVSTVMIAVVDPNSLPGGAANLPDGSIVALNGSDYQVSYPSGPGNGVALTLTSQASIQWMVWSDSLGNGVFQAGAPGFAGVLVQLLNEPDSSVLATTTTDSNGLYSFAGVAPGTYYVVFSQSNNYTFSRLGQDNNARASGITPAFVVGANESVVQNAGLVQIFAPPVAQNDNYNVTQGTPLTVSSPGILSNDADANGFPLTAVVINGPAHGALTLNADGSFTYTPNQGFIGTDSFTYVCNDGPLNSNMATVTLRVLARPVAHDDHYTGQAGHPLVVYMPGVLANDYDPNGLSLTAILVSGPAHGTLTLNADGSFTYTPNSGFSGSDSFTYVASDGVLESDPATVTLAVNGSGNLNGFP